MSKYAVFVEGNNFLMDIQGTQKRLGFFITKVIEAPSEEEATQLAIQELKKSPKLARAYERSNIVEPTMEAKVNHHLTDDSEMKDTGFTFYPMESNDF